MYSKGRPIKILEIGPSPSKSRGGIATVIRGIEEDRVFLCQYDITIHESYKDGSKLTRKFFSIVKFLSFLFSYKKYDIFHIHMASYNSTFRKLMYLFFLEKCNKKTIVHIHGGAFMHFYNGLGTWTKFKLVEILNRADKVIALSEEWKRNFENLLGLNKCVAICNGIKVGNPGKERFDSLEYRSSFLFLGKLCQQKGIYDLIDAIETFVCKGGNVLFYFAGDGDIKKVIEVIHQKKLSNSIKVIGWIDAEEKIDIFNKVGTVVLPSYNEGLPMTILEGMANGKVIISSNVGAIPEIINNNENGVLVNPGDIDGLALAMEKIVTDIEFDKNCAVRNVKKIEKHFSERKMHIELSNLFEEVFYKNLESNI